MRRGGFPWTTAIIALIIIVVALGALFYFSGAEVDVTPNQATVTAAGSYTAVASATSSDALPFEIVTAQKTATQNVSASGTKTVTSNAQGSVTIYNTQSVAQKLITNTRFETTGGLIYRIHGSVSVPAAKSGTPGSITATVYADAPGAQYNVGASSFTLPGLANSPQFTQVYAKSTAAMAGGASGTVPVVTAADESSAVTALQAQLASSLQSELEGQIPAGYVLLTGATATSYSELPVKAVEGTTDSATITEQGTISAVVFPNADLARVIAKGGLGASYDGEPYTIQNPPALTLAAPTGLPVSGATSFTFLLSGSPTLISTIDPARIAAAVAGKTREAAQVALTNYPEVKSAVLILRPFWKSSFPEDPAAISVQVAAPQ